MGLGRGGTDDCEKRLCTKDEHGRRATKGWSRDWARDRRGRGARGARGDSRPKECLARAPPRPSGCLAGALPRLPFPAPPFPWTLSVPPPPTHPPTRPAPCCALPLPRARPRRTRANAPGSGMPLSLLPQTLVISAYLLVSFWAVRTFLVDCLAHVHPFFSRVLAPGRSGSRGPRPEAFRGPVRPGRAAVCGERGGSDPAGARSGRAGRT